MSRFYLHLRSFGGDLIEDEEGSDLPSLAAAKQLALDSMHEMVGDAIKQGAEPQFEAIVLTDDAGTQVASVPILAALPSIIVGLLKAPTKVIPANRFEDYRKNADDCRAKAEAATDPDDKQSWLKLADGWLRMLPGPASDIAGWPKVSDEDSKASH